VGIFKVIVKVVSRQVVVYSASFCSVLIRLRVYGMYRGLSQSSEALLVHVASSSLFAEDEIADAVVGDMAP